MSFKLGLLWAAIFAGSLAIPTPVKRASINSRIVGGIEAPDGSDPHMVALVVGEFFRGQFCGGSIISARTVLTAAHCVEELFFDGSLVGSLNAVVGTNRWNDGGESYAFSHNITHPHFSYMELKNDISLLFTTTEIIFSPTIRPVALSFEEIGGGVDVRVAGWGRTQFGGVGSIPLLELSMKTVDSEDCMEQINSTDYLPEFEPETELCTFHSVGHGICHGDSGSALTRKSDGKQIGIVSWLYPCARGYPDVFVRVSAYEEFITTNIL